MIVFNKYEKRGAYHWRQYQKGGSYHNHVNRVVDWVREGKTLDVGAGDGLITSLLGVHGIDDNECAVRLAKQKRVQVELVTAYDLHKYTGYENVLMLDVIEHLEYPEKVLNEIKKVLVEGGFLYITAPLVLESGELRKYHYQEWTEVELIDFMETNGFKCISIETVVKYERIYGVFEL